jgi:hypothetical protein
MRCWKTIIPELEQLTRMQAVTPGELFVDADNNPSLESIYILDKYGELICLSWSYIDIEFKFEIYCLSIDKPRAVISNDFISVGKVPDFTFLSFLLRSEWVRPTHPAEVPDSFEKVIEESGPSSLVPPSATAIGTTLYGVVFADGDRKPLLMIAIDDIERYRLKIIVDSDTMTKLISTCDSYSLSELMMRQPAS